MVRSPCCEDDGNLKKGPWTPEEDEKLVEYIKNHGYGSWRALPKLADLNRCGKSCRLRWTNYLRPDIKRGKFSDEEEEMIIKLHSVLGNKEMAGGECLGLKKNVNGKVEYTIKSREHLCTLFHGIRWSRIAAHLPGRTDNEIKNFWNTHVKKKFLKMGLDPKTHQPRTDYNSLMNLSQILSTANLSKIQLLQNILQFINTGSVLSQNINGVSSLLPGSHISTPLEGFVNGNPILESVGFPNLGVIPDSHNDYQANSSTWACIEDGFRSEVLNFNINNCSSSSYDIPIEQPLPALASFSPESSSIIQMERKMNPAFASAASSPSDIFEATWGELMDDEIGGSYWKDILE